MRAWADAGWLRLDWSGADRLPGPHAVILRDASGREVLRRPVDADAASLALPRAAAGFLWAELRAGNRVAARAAVVP